MLALDFDVARGDIDHQGAGPWLELPDAGRALALRFPAIDTAPMASLGGQISPPGARAKARWLAAAHDVTGGGQVGCRASERAGLSPGGPVMVSCLVRPLPGLRGNGPDQPLLSTMRHGTGRLRYVAPGYERARRLTFGYLAGEDAERPLPSVHLELHKALETPEAWHEARPSNENRIPAGSDPLLWLAPLDGSGPKPREAQYPWPP